MVTQDLCDGCVQIFYMKSTDSAPTGATNGSVIIEVDTGNAYMYDLDNNFWWAIKPNSVNGNTYIRGYLYTGTDNGYYVGNDYGVYTSRR